MSWIVDNWAGIALVLSAGVNLFCAVAAVTKTPKDDKIATWLKNAAARFLSIH